MWTEIRPQVSWRSRWIYGFEVVRLTNHLVVILNHPISRGIPDSRPHCGLGMVHYRLYLISLRWRTPAIFLPINWSATSGSCSIGAVARFPGLGRVKSGWLAWRHEEHLAFLQASYENCRAMMKILEIHEIWGKTWGFAIVVHFLHLGSLWKLLDWKHLPYTNLYKWQSRFQIFF